MKSIPASVTVVFVLVAFIAGSLSASAQSPMKGEMPSAILFKNVKVFDGKSDTLSASTLVLIVGNKIEKIAVEIALPEKATVIDGGGRTLLPGLIDAHVHLFMIVKDGKIYRNTLK